MVTNLNFHFIHKNECRNTSPKKSSQKKITSKTLVENLRLSLVSKKRKQKLQDRQPTHFRVSVTSSMAHLVAVSNQARSGFHQLATIFQRPDRIIKNKNFRNKNLLESNVKGLPSNRVHQGFSIEIENK